MGFADYNASQQATTDQFPGSNPDLYGGISKALEVVPVHVAGSPPDFADKRGMNGPGSAQAPGVALYDQEPNLVSVGKAMNGFYNLDPAGLVQLQERLVLAGALDAGKFIPGQPDPETEKAYAEVVKRAAFSGRSILTILDQSAKAVQAMGGIDALAKSKRAPLSLDLSNPNDIRRVVMAGAEKVYGHANVDEATIQKIIGAVQQQQAAEQTAKYNGAASVTQAADPATTAQNMLESADPQAAATQQYRSYGDEVFKLLAGGSVQ